MSRTVELFYDVVSTYSYLASTQLAAISDRTGATFVWRPVLLGAVMKATGNAPPASLPARAPYLMTDVQRWCRRYGVTFKLPARFPTNTLTAMRALTALEGDERVAASHRLFHAYFVDGADVSDASVLTGLLGEGPVAMASEPAIKAALRATTEEAVARGAFGAPSFFLDGEMYFGNDRLHFLEEALQS